VALVHATKGALLALVIFAAILDACAFTPDPPISCEDISSVDCGRAVAMARPLLSSYWGSAREVIVHTGFCARFMHCPPSAVNDKTHLMVELIFAETPERFVRIEIGPRWAATCSKFVATANEGHTEPC
jgi:hypothetical protein